MDSRPVKRLISRKLSNCPTINLFYKGKKYFFVFRKTESRLKTFELLMEPGDILSESKISIKELAEAGYVRWHLIWNNLRDFKVISFTFIFRTSPMNSACFFCHKLLDLSNSKTRFEIVSFYYYHLQKNLKGKTSRIQVISLKISVFFVSKIIKISFKFCYSFQRYFSKNQYFSEDLWK